MYDARRPVHRAIIGMVGLVSLTGCAEVPKDPAEVAAYEQANDPAESINRVIFKGNQWVDSNAFQPVARAYSLYVPEDVRGGVHNFSQNLGEPLVMVNDVLQGNTSRAWNTTQRFVVNSTVGVAGIFDIASGWDLQAHQADFGQTMGVWGVSPGPSVQLPLLGQSNLRDAAGTAFGILGDPVGYVPGLQSVQIVGSVTGAVDGRADMLPVTDDLERTSIDYYAATRSLYAQSREGLVAEGKVGGGSAEDESPRPPTP